MINSKQIVLALLFGEASAAVDAGPFPDTTAGTRNVAAWGTGVYTLAGAPDVMVAEKLAIVEEDTKNAGLYSCLRSGLVPITTQGLTNSWVDNTSFGLVVGAQEAVTMRSFYTTKTADTGAPATVPLAANVAVTTEMFYGYCDTGTGVQCFAGLPFFDTVKSVYECCPDVAGVDIATKSACSSYFQVDITGDGTNYTGADATTAIVPVPNRLTLWNDSADALMANTEAAVAYTYQEDFILGSMAQLSDETLAADNWCDQNLFTDISSTSAYTATTGFSNKTKCTWQVKAAATKAPQFEISAATTSNFSLQWIEWSDTSLLTAGSVMPATVLVASVATNFMIGAYDTADGVYFNVFDAGFEPVTGTASALPSGADGFKPALWDDFLPGSIGNVNWYLNNEDSMLEYDVDGTANPVVIDSWAFINNLNSLEPIYSEYGTAVSTYNDDADDYNTAVIAYNKALEDGEKELPEVPEKPCPPTKPEAWSGIEIVTDDTWTTATLAADLEDVSGPAVVYKMLDASSTVPTNDSFRYGYLSVVEDVADIAALTAPAVLAYDPLVQASHIFGRLGQGEETMPDANAPFRWAAEDAQLQHMQVSIFPEDGFAFNGGAAIGSEVVFTTAMHIELDITEAAISYSAGFEAPTASGSADDLEEMDAAAALVYSAVAAAAVLVSLY